MDLKYTRALRCIFTMIYILHAVPDGHLHTPTNGLLISPLMITDCARWTSNTDPLNVSRVR